MRCLLIFALCFMAIISSVNAFWEDDNTINASLPDVGAESTLTVFLMDGTWYLIAGESDGTFNGFNWTGSAWQSDSAIVSNLGDVGVNSKPNVFNIEDAWYLIAGESDGNFNGFNWTGSAWQSDSAIVSNLGDVGDNSAPSVFLFNGNRYLIAGEQFNGNFNGFNWTGSAWQSDSAIVSNLGGVGIKSTPSVFLKDNTLYLISGENTRGAWNGYNWTGSAWQSDSAIVSNLGDVGLNTAPNVFMQSGELYLIIGNFAGTFNGFIWNENTTVTTPTINSPSGTSTNTSVILNATIQDDTCVYWFNDSEFITGCDDPIDSTSLVGHWNLGEGNGNSWISNQNVSDLSGNSNDGEIFGVEYVAGRYEKGMEFNGISSYIEVLDSASLQTSDDMTILLWLRSDITGSDMELIVKRDAGGANYLLWWDVPTNKISFYDGADTRTADTSLSADTWYHIGVVIDSGVSTTFYLNGVADGSPGATTITSDDAPLLIGKRHLNDHYFDGIMDDVRIYNRSLSAAEILDEYRLSQGYFNWTADFERTDIVEVQSSDSYINSSTASSSLTVDYTDVVILNESDSSVLDENMNIQIINRSTFGEIDLVVGTSATFKDVDELIGQRIVFRSSNASSSDFEGFREIEEPAYVAGADFTIYMPKTSVDTTGFHEFKIRDFTTDWSTANVIFRRDVGAGLATMQESFVDVENKVSVYLIKDREYQIIVNKSDDTRIFGFYKATHDSLTSALSVELNMVNITEWTDRQYLNKDINFTTFQNGTTIFFAYDNVGITSTLQWWVFNGTNTSQVLFSGDANGSSTALFSYSPPDANDTHLTYFCANNSVFGFFCKWDTPKAVIDYDWLDFGGPRIPAWAPTAVAMSVILVIGGLFGGVDSKTGGLALAGSVVFFWYIGWLDLGSRTQGIAIVGLVVFMAVSNKLMEGAR